MFDNKSTVLVHDNDSMSIHSLIALIRIKKFMMPVLAFSVLVVLVFSC